MKEFTNKDTLTVVQWYFTLVDARILKRTVEERGQTDLIVSLEPGKMEAPRIELHIELYSTAPPSLHVLRSGACAEKWLSIQSATFLPTCRKRRAIA